MKRETIRKKISSLTAKFAALLLAALGCAGSAWGATVTTEAELRAAIASGGTVTLGADIALTQGEIAVSNTVTLDLATFTISSPTNVFRVAANGNFTVNADATAPGGIYTTATNACVYTAYGLNPGPKTIVINGGVFDGNCVFNFSDVAAANIKQRYGIDVAGAGSGEKADPTSVTINGGTFQGGYSLGNVGAYRCYYFTVNGGTFERGLDCADTEYCSIGVTTTCKAYFTGGKYRDRYPAARRRNHAPDTGKVFIGSNTHTNVYYIEGDYYVIAYDYSECDGTASFTKNKVRDASWLSCLFYDIHQEWYEDTDVWYYKGAAPTGTSQTHGDLQAASPIQPVIPAIENVSVSARPAVRLLSASPAKQLLSSSETLGEIKVVNVADDGYFTQGSFASSTLKKKLDLGTIDVCRVFEVANSIWITSSGAGETGSGDDDATLYSQIYERVSAAMMGYGDELLTLPYTEAEKTLLLKYADQLKANGMKMEEKNFVSDGNGSYAAADLIVPLCVRSHQTINAESASDPFESDAQLNWNMSVLVSFDTAVESGSVLVWNSYRTDTPYGEGIPLDSGKSFSLQLDVATKLSYLRGDKKTASQWASNPLLVALQNKAAENVGKTVTVTLRLVNPDNSSDYCDRASFSYTFTAETLSIIPKVVFESIPASPTAAEIEKLAIDQNGDTIVNGSGSLPESKFSSLANNSVAKSSNTDTGLASVGLAEESNEATTATKYLSIAFKQMRLNTASSGCDVLALSYNVKPMAKIVSGNTDTTRTITDTELNNQTIKFRLPLTDEYTERALVVHKSSDATYSEERWIANVEGSTGAHYVEISTTHFSEFTVSPIGANDIVYVTSAAGTFIGGYTTLAAAVAEATEGQTITLLADATDSLVTIPSTVTFDAGGFDYTAYIGAGTSADPYQISNLSTLKAFRDYVDLQLSDGTSQYAGKYFKLTSDIDLSGENWEPIGSMVGDHGSFKGVFDGDNHTIKNLSVQKAEKGLGFFSYTTGDAMIKNLTFTNVTVKSTAPTAHDKGNWVGGVVGDAFANTVISNVHVVGSIDIEGYGYVGGMVGHGYVKVYDSAVEGEGTIKGNMWCTGGIVGYAGEGTTDVRNSFVTGTGTGLTVQAAAGGCGAIVGMAEDDSGRSPISGSNLAATNVTVGTFVGGFGTSYATYCLGYLYGGNSDQYLSGGLTVNNVTFDAQGNANPPVQDAVATVDDTIYFVLSSAVDAAQSGDIVTVTRNLKLRESISIDSDVTIDLAGKTIALADGVESAFVISGDTTTLTVNNGTAVVAIEGYDSNYRVMSETDGAATIYSAVPCAAEIAGTPYRTFAEAIAAAQSGDTVTLLADTAVADTITINKSMTLDLNGKTITNTSTGKRPFYVVTEDPNSVVETADEEGNVVFEGATTLTVEGNGGSLVIPDGGTAYGFFDIAKPYTGIVINGGTISGDGGNGSLIRYGVDGGYAQQIALNNVTGITKSRIVSYASAYYLWDIKVVGGTYTHNNYRNDNGGYLKNAFQFFTQNGIFDGVTITSDEGSCVCCGGSYQENMVFRNNTFTVNEKSIISDPWNNAAIAVQSAGSLTIESGTYTSAGIYGVATANSGATINIEGGTITGADYGVRIYGGGYDPDTTLNISGTASVTGGQAGVYVLEIGNGNGTATANINGGTIAGGITIENQTAVSSRATVNIEDGEVSGTLTDASPSGKSGVYSVSGGNFSEQVLEKYCAAGFDPTTTPDENGKYTVNVKDGIVARNITKNIAYATLAEAFSAAQAGDTVQLLANVSLTEMLTISNGKNVTLDLAGFSIVADDANWTVGDSIFCVAYGATLTIDDSTGEDLGMIDTDESEKAFCAIKMTNKGDDSANGTAALVVNGGAIYGTYYGISGNGTRHGTSVTINGGEISAYADDGIGIYQPQNGSLVITGTGDGGISGATAVYVKSGTVAISGGMLWGTGAASAYNVSGNGANPTGDAIVIDNCGYPGGAPSATITGGFFRSDFAGNVGSYASGSGNDAISGFVSGGGFHGAQVPEEYCAEGYIPGTEVDEDGFYTVKQGVYVAQIVETGVKYENLMEAIDAAYNGGTVELLKDVTVNRWHQNVWSVEDRDDLTYSGNRAVTGCNGLTINGNGHSLTINSIDSGSNGNQIFYGSRNLTVSNITINAASGVNGIGLKSGLISDVTFNMVGSNPAIYTSGSAGCEEGEHIEIRNCTFNTEAADSYAIYSCDPGNGVDVGTVISGNTFNTRRSVALRSDMQFLNNTVNGEKGVTVAEGSTAVVSGNYFSETTTSRSINVYPSNATIENNVILGPIELEDKTYETAPDLSGNYWGGDAPANLPEGVVVNSYYTTYNGYATPSQDGSLFTLSDQVVFVAQIGTTKYETLAEAIAAAQDGDTIELLKDVEWDGTGAFYSLNVAGSVTIDGKGHTLSAPTSGGPGNSVILLGDAGATSRNDGKSYTIRNLTVSGFSGLSHIVRIQGVNATIENCNFEDNTASTDIVASDFSNLALTDSTFAGNSVSGAATVNVGYSSDGDTTSTTTITGNLFDGNTSTAIGEVYINDAQGASEIDGNTFRNNVDALAVVFVANSADVTGNLFAGNRITGSQEKLTTVVVGPWGASSVEYEVNVTGNAFDGNAHDNGSTFDVYLESFAGSHSAAFDVNGNYWKDGVMPVAGSEYAYNTVDGANTAIAGVKTYATAYDVDESGRGAGVTLEVCPVAKIGSNYYATLAEAIAAAQDGDTVKLLKDSSGSGIVVPENKFGTSGLTVDFGGHTYTVNSDPLAGSTGTKTQAFQLLKDNKITFKDGAIVADHANVKMLIQNYADLTLDNMTLDATKGSNNIGYVLSTNNGSTTINDTTIVAKENGVAFDACSGWGGYASNEIKVTGTSNITGDIEVSFYGQDNTSAPTLTLTSGTHTGAIKVAQGFGEATVYKSSDFTQEAPADYKWVETETEGVSKLVPKVYVAQNADTGVKYETLADAIAAVPTDGTPTTITMIADETGARGISVASGKNFTVDFAGHTYTVNKPGAGSSGTENQAFQLLKNSTITFKNGTIQIDPDNLIPAVSPAQNISRIIQNYANLTLDNMVIDARNQYGGEAYALSFNNGTSSLINGTKIITTSNDTVAFDVYDWTSSYPNGSQLTIGDGVVINGKIVFDNSGNTEGNTTLTITGGRIGQVVAANGSATDGQQIQISGGTFDSAVPEEYCASSYVPNDNGDGTYGVEVGYAAEDIVYPVAQSAGVPIPLAWATNNTGVVSGGYVKAADVPAIIAALGQNGVNGLPVWQSYVLGLDSKSAAGQLRVNAGPVDGEPTKVLITTAVNVPAALVNNGTTVTYRLAERNADGATWKDLESGAAKPEFTKELHDVAGKVLTIFADIETE